MGITGRYLYHTKSNCKYQIVIAPKCSRKMFYESNRGNIVRLKRSEYRGMSKLCRDIPKRSVKF